MMAFFHFSPSRVSIATKSTLFLVGLLLALCVGRSSAAPGDLDLSFDPGSTVDGTVYAIAVLSDGKVLIGGEFTTVHDAMCGGVARLNADGSTDLTFLKGLVGARSDSGGGGVDCLAVQPDGKILIGGSFTNVNGLPQNRIARLQSDGTLDNSFLNGLCGADARVQALALQSDGKILLGGWFTSVNGAPRTNIARLNIDGSLDASFLGSLAGASGDYHTIYTLGLQDDGKILLGGWFTAVNGVARTNIARLHPDGSLDTTFAAGIPGTSTTRVLSLVLQSDGKILLGGDFSAVNGVERKRIARLNGDGTLDMSFVPSPSFGPGQVPAYILAVQDDRKVLIGGWFDGGTGIQRLNLDGSLDDAFPLAPNGPYGVVYAAAVQSDRKILIGGDFASVGDVGRKSMARLHGDGTLDGSFNNGPAGPNGPILSCAVQPDGKIVVGGGFYSVDGHKQGRVARFKSDGALDASFNGMAAPDTVNVLVLQTDGKILLGPSQNGFGRLLRLNSDGTLDTSFHSAELASWIPNPGWPPYQVRGWIKSIALQTDGKILICGVFETIDGVTRNNIARLNSDGTLDAGFGAGVTVQEPVLRLQSDGKILVGDILTSGGASQTAIVRLNRDGSRDTSFSPPLAGPPERNWFSSLAIQSDARILVGGGFTSINGVAQTNIARLNPNGSLDTSFRSGLTELDRAVRAMVVQTDDKILIGGDFTIVDGEQEDNIARLNSDGSLDRSFACRVGSWTYALSFSLQSDGKIVLTGRFSSVNGIPRNGVARLLSDCEPPRLGNCRFENGNFAFDLSGEPGKTVVIQGSTDLQHWIPIATNMLSSQPIPFSDSQNTGLPERFYRLMVP